MTLLITIFAIGVVGVVGTIGFKVIEEKYDKLTLLPERIKRNEENIEKHARYLAKRCTWWCRFKARTFSIHAQTHAMKVAERIRNGSYKARISKPLSRNGSASVFLKEMVQHKNDVRKNNGYH